MTSTDHDSVPAEPGNEADAFDEDDDFNRLDRTQSRAVLEYLARQIVDNPDGVVIEQSETRSGIKLSLHVATEDMGKVIGRRGRVAQSIRTVVRAAGAREGVDVLVDIVD